MPSEEQTVVQGYLYANEPSQSIYISSSYAIGSDSDTNTPITDAIVTVTKAGKDYRFIQIADVPGMYSYTGNDFAVLTGSELNLRIDRGGTIVTSTTTVPPPPSHVRLSGDSIAFTEETITTPFGSRILLRSKGDLTVRWDNPSQNYFYVTIEAVDPNRQLLQSDSIPRVFRFVSRPTISDSAGISAAQISYTGRHRVKVYRVNKEYADLYKSREQDSRQLNEPLTNIVKGLGIFTAVNCDSVFFTVVRQ